MEMSVLPVGVEPVAYTKAVRAAALPWNQRRERRRRIEERARSPRRLLEQSAEAAHSFHPVRSIEPQPVHDWGQVIRNRPAIVRAKFPSRTIRQHERKGQDCSPASSRWAKTCIALIPL